MNFTKQLNETMFRAVGLCFSAVLIVLSLLTGIKTAAVNDDASKLRQQTEVLKAENELLSARYDNSLSLEELETYASDVLGMQRCNPSQIFYIELD